MESENAAFNGCKSKLFNHRLSCLTMIWINKPVIQISKQCTIDPNLSILTNEQDLQVMNQKMQKKTLDGNYWPTVNKGKKDF